MMSLATTSVQSLQVTRFAEWTTAGLLDLLLLKRHPSVLDAVSKTFSLWLILCRRMTRWMDLTWRRQSAGPTSGCSSEMVSS